MGWEGIQTVRVVAGNPTPVLILYPSAQQRREERRDVRAPEMDARIRPPPKFTIFWGTASSIKPLPGTSSRKRRSQSLRRKGCRWADTSPQLLLFSLASRALASPTTLDPGTRDTSVPPALQTTFTSRRRWHLGEARKDPRGHYPQTERRLGHGGPSDNVAPPAAPPHISLLVYGALRGHSASFHLLLRPCTSDAYTSQWIGERPRESNESGQESGMRAAERVGGSRQRMLAALGEKLEDEVDDTFGRPWMGS
ncbi:hypothetical protein C8R43DRAFT_945791 [Mycena crocata]|nr:hypothetical protein C8R43DRAFT_945791 [Mycena crocata]